METKRKDIPVVNFFDEVITAHIDAYYKKGKFYDYYTDKEIKLREDDLTTLKGVIVRIVAPLHNIDDENYQVHSQKHEERIMKKGEYLFFGMDYKKENKSFEFKIDLVEDLWVEKIGNKLSKLKTCKCIVADGTEKHGNSSINNFQPIVCNSLNHAFTRTSIKYRPENASHTCNAFKTFRTKDGNIIDCLR